MEQEQQAVRMLVRTLGPEHGTEPRALGCGEVRGVGILPVDEGFGDAGSIGQGGSGVHWRVPGSWQRRKTEVPGLAGRKPVIASILSLVVEQQQHRFWDRSSELASST